jgi:hypothetical protein
MDKPQTGELWIHKKTGDTFIVKELYNLSSQTFKNSYRNELTIVKAIRLRDQYEWNEPLGMFTWELQRLN